MTDARLTRQSVRVLVQGTPEVRETRIVSKAAVLDVPDVRLARQNIQSLATSASDARLASQQVQALFDSSSEVRLANQQVQVLRKNYLKDSVGYWGIKEDSFPSGPSLVAGGDAASTALYTQIPAGRPGDIVVVVTSNYDAGREATGPSSTGLTFTAIRNTGNYLRAWYTVLPDTLSREARILQLDDSGSHGCHAILVRGAWISDAVDGTPQYTDHGTTAPFNVPSYTTTVNKAVVFSCITSTDDNTWRLDEPGWTLLSNRNHSTVFSSAVAYKIVGPGASGSQLWTQTTGVGPDTTRSLTFAIKLAY